MDGRRVFGGTILIDFAYVGFRVGFVGGRFLSSSVPNSQVLEQSDEREPRGTTAKVDWISPSKGNRTLGRAGLPPVAGEPCSPKGAFSAH